MGEKMATREAYGKALAQLALEDKRVVVLDADLSKSTKTVDFAAVAPERFFNVGIAEGNMAGIAAGLAASGKVPFYSSFAVFAVGRAFEQIRNSIAYPGLNVKIAASHAGITVGEDGGSHQSVEDIALMRVLPGMTVVVPCDGLETMQATKALAEYYGPAYLRLGRLPVAPVNDDSYQFQLGKGVLLKEGKDIAIFACGMMVGLALEAAELLAEEGICAAVANIHTIKPLDEEFVLGLTADCGAAISVEEHSIIGGLGSALAETFCENTPIPFSRVGIEDKFGQSGSPDALLSQYGLTASAIAAKAKKTLARK